MHLIINVVQQTFGGRLNFVPHLHMTVSAGGLHESTGCWIHRIEYKNREVMLAWRYAVGAFLSEAFRKGVLKSNLSRKEFRALLEAQHQRPWNVFVSRCSPKHYWLKHDGRYIRRPPVAQHRLQLVGDDEVEYWAKDTRKKSHVLVRHKRTEFVDMLIQHVTGPGSHSMRYFGLLSPRSKARLWAAIFVLLHQKQRSRPPRLTWRSLLMKTFGTDPLLDSHGQLMRWTGRRQPIAPSA